VTVAHTKTLETRVSEEVPGEGAASLQITADLLAVIPNLRAFACPYAAISIAPTISSRRLW